MDVRTALTIATLWLSRAPPADTPFNWPQTVEEPEFGPTRRHQPPPRDIDGEWWVPDEASLAALFAILSHPWTWRLVLGVTYRMGNIGRRRMNAITVDVDAVALEGAKTLDELAHNGKAVVDALHDDKEDGNGYTVLSDPEPEAEVESEQTIQNGSDREETQTPPCPDIESSTQPKPKERSPRRLRSIFSFFGGPRATPPPTNSSDLPPIQGVSFDDAALQSVGGPTPPELEQALQAALGTEHLNLDDWTGSSTSRSVLTPKTDLDVTMGVVEEDKTPADEIVALSENTTKAPEPDLVVEKPRDQTPEPHPAGGDSQVLSDSVKLMDSAVLVEPGEDIADQKGHHAAEPALLVEEPRTHATEPEVLAEEPRTPQRPSTPKFVAATTPSQVSTTPSSFVDLQSPFTEDEDQVGSPFTVVDTSSPEQSLHIQRARAPSPDSPSPIQRAPTPDSPVNDSLPPIIVPAARPISGRKRFSAPPSLAAVQSVLPPPVSLSGVDEVEDGRLGEAEASSRATKRRSDGSSGGGEKKGKGSANPGWMRMGEGTRPLVWFVDGPAQFGSQPALTGHEEDDEDDYDHDFEYDEDDDALEEGELDGEVLDYGVPEAGALEDVYEEEEEEEEDRVADAAAPLQVRNWTPADEDDEDERTVTIRTATVVPAPTSAAQDPDQYDDGDEDAETRSNHSVPDIVVSVVPESPLAVEAGVNQATGPPVGSVRREEEPDDYDEEEMEEVAVAYASGEKPLLVEELEVDDVLPEEDDVSAASAVAEAPPLEDASASAPVPEDTGDDELAPVEPVSNEAIVEDASPAAVVVEIGPATETIAAAGAAVEQLSPVEEPTPVEEPAATPAEQAIHVDEVASAELALEAIPTVETVEPPLEAAAPIAEEAPVDAGAVVAEAQEPAAAEVVAEDATPAAGEQSARTPTDVAPAQTASPDSVDEPPPATVAQDTSGVLQDEEHADDVPEEQPAARVEAADAVADANAVAPVPQPTETDDAAPAVAEEDVPPAEDAAPAAPTREPLVDDEVPAGPAVEEILEDATQPKESSSTEPAATLEAETISANDTPVVDEHAPVDESAPVEQAEEQSASAGLPPSTYDDDEGVLVEAPASKEPTPAPEEPADAEEDVSHAADDPAPIVTPESPPAPELVVFSLKGKGLRFNTADDLAPYLNEVPDLSKVTEICLSGNTLGVKAANALAESIRGMSSLRVATLSDLFTGRLDTEIPLALAALCEALTEAKSLVEFNVSDNAIGQYVDALVPLFSRNHSIRVLKLNNLGFGPYAGNIVAEALIAAVSQGERSNLRVMISGRHHIENGAAPSWGRMFAAHGGLTGVDMQSAWIGAAGFREIAYGLAHCKGLRHLNLDDNLGRDSEDDAWPAFAESLRSWTKLRFCNVASCKMENDGALAILDVLAEGNHKELHTLVLDNSDLTEDVYSQLRDVVEHQLPALRVLSIADNDDLEDNEDIAAIQRVMEEREGEVVLEDDLDRRWSEPVDEADSLDEVIMGATANTDAAADAIASEIREAMT